MRIILVGHPGSQFLVPASKYLTDKYLPGFDIHWLNWVGEKRDWSNFLATYLAHLDDKYVIVALDDYLVTGFHKDRYEEALKLLTPDVACVKLHETNLTEHRGYPVTTQYTIWDREFLINLLAITKDPWHFEMTGSDVFRQMRKQSIFLEKPVIEYDVHSALSTRWEGVNWNGVSEEDLNIIKKLCEF